MAYSPGELLVRGGAVSAAALRKALELRKQDGGTVGECLVRLGAIDEATLATFYHKRLVLPLVDSGRLAAVSPAALKLVPAEVAVEFRLIPVAIDRDGSVLVVMADPSDNHAVEELGFFVDRFVLRAVATLSAVRRAIERHYGVALGELTPTSTTQPTQPARATAPRTKVEAPPQAAAHAHREAFISTGPIFPRNVEPPYDPLRATPVNRAPTEEVVLLTKKKRRDTPLMVAPVPGARPSPPVEQEEPVLLTKRRARTGTLPGIFSELAPEPPIDALRAAKERDEVARLLLDYASGVLGRAALFVVRHGDLCGYDARGGDLDRASVEMLKVPLTAESLFRDVVESCLPYRGPLPSGARNRTLGRALGAAANAEVLVLPITVRGRVVALLFGDRLAHLLPEAALQALCHEAGLAYERILVRTRAESADRKR